MFIEWMLENTVFGELQTCFEIGFFFCQTAGNESGKTVFGSVCLGELSKFGVGQIFPVLGIIKT